MAVLARLQVCFLRDENSQRERERGRQRGSEITHLRYAEGHIWESVHAADGPGAHAPRASRAPRAPQHACTQAAAANPC